MLFRCILAFLYEGLSVRRSVGPSVGDAFFRILKREFLAAEMDAIELIVTMGTVVMRGDERVVVTRDGIDDLIHFPSSSLSPPYPIISLL